MDDTKLFTFGIHTIIFWCGTFFKLWLTFFKKIMDNIRTNLDHIKIKNSKFLCYKITTFKTCIN